MKTKTTYRSKLSAIPGLSRARSGFCVNGQNTPEVNDRGFIRFSRILRMLPILILLALMPMAGFFVVSAASTNSENSADTNGIVALPKTEFSADEQPVFTVEVGKRPNVNILGIGKVDRKVTKVTLTAPDGSVQPLQYEAVKSELGGTTYDLLRADTENFSQPGKYSAAFTLKTGNKEEVIWEVFYWGVLVMNPDQAEYRPGESATVDFGMVDDTGNTICNADMKLTVTNPFGKEQVFTTADGSIAVSKECGPNSVTKIPDYRTEVPLDSPGEYRFHLEATAAGSRHAIEQTVQVSDDISFEIRRIGPSRIWPQTGYTMNLYVTPQADYRGTVEESVPADFAIKPISSKGKVIVSPDKKIVRWDVDWRAGKVYQLNYTFDAPDVSPALFTLGPVSIGKYVEPRQWQIASDTVANNGLLTYGDVANLGIVKFRTYTNTTWASAWGNETSTALSTSSSRIAFLISRANPTRDEIMIGQKKLDGRLDVQKCTKGANSTVCDAAGDFSSLWNVAGQAMTCEGTEADCTRSYDIAYEQLSGRAMVVYGNATSQKLYYCYYDGTNWGPVSNCAATNGTNDISLTSNGRPTRVSLKSLPGTNKIILGTGIDVTSTHEVEAYIWSGSAWGNGVVATDTTNAVAAGLDHGQSFDVAWEEGTGDAIVTYATTATVEIKYKLFSSGAWGSEADAINTNSNGSSCIWLQADTEPGANRVAIACNDSANDIAAGVWKDDGSTPQWTDLTSSVGEASLEGSNGTTAGPPYTDIVWQKTGSQAIIFAQNAGSSSDIEYSAIACTGAGCTAGGIDSSPATAGTDDGQFVKLASSPNSNDIMALWSDIDRNLNAQLWSAGAWQSAASATFNADISNGSADNLTTGLDSTPANFVYIPYSPWSRNWKFWQGTDTTNTPTNQLAGENTTPTGLDPDTGKFRLRFSVAELSGNGQIDARKKLQYATADPDAASTTWTDVDDPAGAGIWRYVDCNSGDANICNDNIALSGTTLSGSPTAGWWNQLKTGGTVTAMDQTGLQLRELEFSVEANAATASTTFYFRMYDIDQNSPVLREQDNDGSNDCATAACTYPSIATGAATISIGGTCLAYDQLTNCGDLGDIAVAVGGSLQAQVDTGGGNGGTFTITGVTKPSNNAIVTVFVNGAPATAANRAVAITKYDGSGGITGLILYKEHLTIGSGDTPATLSSSELGSYDNSVASGDDDVFFDYRVDWTTNSMTATGGAITGFQIDCDSPATTCNNFSTQEELYIQTSWTYQPATAVATHDVENLGTLNVGTNALTISGSYLNSSTFTKSATQTTTFTSGSTGETITAGSSSFANVTFNGAGDWATQTNAVTVDEVLTITAGTLKMGGVTHTITGITSITGTLELTSATGTKTFTGAVTVNSGGAWNASGNSTSTFVGGLTNNNAGGINLGTGIQTFTSAQNIAGSGAIAIPSLTLGTAGQTITVTNTNATGLTISTALVCTGNLAMGGTNAVLTITKTGTLCNSGAGTFAAAGTGNTVIYNFAGTQTVYVTAYVNLTLGGTSAKTMAVVTVNGDFNMSGSATTTTSALATVGGNIILAGTSQLTLGTVALVTVTGDITVGTGTTLAANVSTTVNGGDITVTSTGALTSSGGTVTMGAGGTVGGTGNMSFYAFATSGTGTTIFNGSGINAIGNNLTVGTGTTLSIDQNVTVTGTTSITGTLRFNSATGTKIFAGGVTINATGTWNNATPSAVTFRGGLTNDSAVAHTWGTVTYTFDTNDQAIGGTNAISMSTVDTATAAKTLTNNGTLTITAALSGAGNFTNSGTGTLNINYTGTQTLGGTFSASTSGNTVSYGASGTQTVFAVTYHNLSLGGTSAKTLTSVATVNGDLSMSGSATATASSLATVGGNIALTSTAALTVDTVALLTVSGNVSAAAGTTLKLNTSTTITGTLTNATTGTITTDAGTPTMTVNGTGNFCGGTNTPPCLFYNLTFGGTPTFQSDFTVTHNLTLPASVTANSKKVTMTGTTGDVVGGGATLFDLTIDPATAGTITLITSNLTVSGTLNVAAGDTLSLNTATLTHTGGTFTFPDTAIISGTGTLAFTSASPGPGTTGTLSSVVRYDATNGDIASTTADARTYGGVIQFYSNSGTARVITLPSGTMDFNGAMSIEAAGANTLNVTGATNDPVYDLEGNFSMAAGGSVETFTTGSGNWNAAGSVDLTNGTYTTEGTHTLIMDGAGTLTSDNETLLNLTLSGSIILANATHTITGSLDMTGGTVTAGSSTVLMNGSSKTVTSAGNTLSGFTASGSIAAQDAFAASGNFTISASSSFAQNANTNMTLTGDTILISDTGTFTKATGSGILILDGVSDNQTFEDANTDAKEDMGNVQIGQSPGVTKLKSDFAATSLTIATGDTFETHGWEVDLSGSLDCQLTCILDLQDDAPNNDTGDPTTITLGGNWTMSATGTFIPYTNSRVEPDGTADQTVTTGGKAFYNFYSNNGAALDANDDVLVTGAFTVNGALTVNDGELDLETNDPATAVTGAVTINTNGELNASSTGSFTVGGAWTNAGTLTANSGTVTFNGTSASASSFNIDSTGAAVDDFNTIVFNDAGDGDTFVLESALDVNGNLTNTGGTLNTKATEDNSINVAGNWTNSDIFTTDGGVVTFDGADGSTQILTGATTFYNFTASTAANTVGRTLRFTHTTIYAVAGSWTITGFSGKKITLESSSAGTQWTINPTAAAVTYVQVSDSNDTGVAICATFSTDTGDNNTGNWNVTGSATCGIDIDGIAYANDNDTGPLNAVEVCVAVDNVSDTDCDTTNASGEFTIIGVNANAGGEQLTFFINGGVTFGNTVTTGDGSSIVVGDNLRVYQNHVVVRYEQGPPLTILEMDAYDNDQNPTDILFDAQDDTPDTLVVEDGNELFVYTGMTFTPGGTVTLDDIQIEGVYVATGAEAIAVSGSWDNNGTFTAASSIVTFDSVGTETVEAGSSSFNNVVFNNGSGTWTVQTDNMTTNDLTLTAGTSFTLANTKVMEVDGNYSQVIAAANTTWTGSTLYLNGSGGMYDINTKTHGGDAYATLRVGGGEDIAMWDSSASTYTIDAGGCLFSEDHGGTAGRLNIYGSCNSRANEYWSYATDFDGAPVTRQADVRFVSGATMTVGNGNTIEIKGQNAGANRSLVNYETSAGYGMAINGTIDAQYYDFDNMNASGLNIGSTATVTELSDGTFDNAGAGASSSYITVATITSTKNFFNNVFDDNADGGDVNVVYNVNADGAGIDWTFFSWSGNKAGESFDNEANGAAVKWHSDLTLSINKNVLDLGVINTLLVGSDSHNLTVTTSAENGYTCSAVEDGNLRNGTDEINDVVGGTVTAGTEGYGISCTGVDCDLAGDNSLSGTPLVVASNVGPVTDSLTAVTYKAAASSATVGTKYSHVVTFTCAGDF